VGTGGGNRRAGGRGRGAEGGGGGRVRRVSSAIQQSGTRAKRTASCRLGQALCGGAATRTAAAPPVDRSRASAHSHRPASTASDSAVSPAPLGAVGSAPASASSCTTVTLAAPLSTAACSACRCAAGGQRPARPAAPRRAARFRRRIVARPLAAERRTCCVGWALCSSSARTTSPRPSSADACRLLVPLCEASRGRKVGGKGGVSG
jgi:hypothetical protein